MAEVARARGANAGQVFKLRRAFERNKPSEPCSPLIPITVVSQQRHVSIFMELFHRQERTYLAPE